MAPPSVPLDAIRHPAVLYDADGRIVAANDLADTLAGRPLTGLSAAEVARIFDVRSPDGTPLPDPRPGGPAGAGGRGVRRRPARRHLPRRPDHRDPGHGLPGPRRRRDHRRPRPLAGRHRAGDGRAGAPGERGAAAVDLRPVPRRALPAGPGDGPGRVRQPRHRGDLRVHRRGMPGHERERYPRACPPRRPPDGDDREDGGRSREKVGHSRLPVPLQRRHVPLVLGPVQDRPGRGRPARQPGRASSAISTTARWPRRPFGRAGRSTAT